MIIGIPKEIKNNEYRVAITPAGVYELIKNGHTVLIQKNAGIGSGFYDEDYLNAGAQIVSVEEAWTSVDMVMKVKEPIEIEYQYFTPGLVLFTYLHLASEPALTQALLESKVISIAYETVELCNGKLPLLTPMSEVAGKMAAQIAAHYIYKYNDGLGILLGGVAGVEKGVVTIIGGGISGTNAARIAIGLGAKVNILDNNPERLRELTEIFGDSISTYMSNSANIEKCVVEADIAIGAVLIAGAKAPKLVSESVVKRMRPGSVIVDIAIDQGGIFETIDHSTTHKDPTYVKHGVVHYAVANMPGAVPRTSTLALTNVTLPYAIKLANKDYVVACKSDPALLRGINTIEGHLTCKAVAQSLNLTYTDINTLL